MNVKYINPFIDATKNVFSMLVKQDAQPGKPYLYNKEENLFDISGIIGLSGQTMGAVVLSFPKMTALKAASVFADQELKVFDQTVIDAIGELINIIAGNAKKDLTDFRLQISLPSVVVGKNHQLNWPTGVPVVAIPFTSGIGEFSLSVSLKDIDKA